jgi:hypothetical protein
MKRLPDELIFGRNSKDEVVRYGDVRKITDDTELIKLLKSRLETYLNKQVEPLTIDSAFPLTVMTCVAVETLGQIFFKEDSSDTSFQFVSVTKKINQVFGRKLSQKYQTKLTETWANKDLKNIDCYGKVLYRFFRNTMIHGYQGKGVFLSYEDTNTIKIDEETSFIVINPNWFWNSYKVAFEKLFDETIKGQSNNSLRVNCLKYIKDNLLE